MGENRKKIDVYIAFPDIANYQRKDYLRSVEAAIKKEIRAKDVSITVRGWDQSTPDNIAQSLRSKDRTVIIAAHIAGDTSIPMTENNLRGKPRTGAQALLINGGYITGAGVQAFSEDGKQYVVAERIQADNVVTCSCQIHPDTASEIAGRMQSGSSFLYLDGGDDGETSVGVDVQIAIDAAVILGNGGSIQDVRDRANTLMKNSVGASSNAGDERAIVCDSNGKCKEK